MFIFTPPQRTAVFLAGWMPFSLFEVADP